jgi:hypothetical protein
VAGASTLSEALFLDYMLARATDERERVVLLQHAIDGIVSTFYTQVLFADYEAGAPPCRRRPATADDLGDIYSGRCSSVPRRRSTTTSLAPHVGAGFRTSSARRTVVSVRRASRRARS